MLYLVGEADICNYADDTTIYTCYVTVDLVIDKLEKHSFEMASWFYKNFMKLNEEKSHFTLYGENLNDHSVKVGPVLIKESTEEKLLGVTLEKRLSFETHTQQLCLKSSQKLLQALARISPPMDSQNLITVLNAFITSQFSYCPLIWMFHSRKTGHKINKFHERVLILAYKESVSTFEQLLTRNNSVTSHERDLRLLITEVFKTK